MSEISRARGWAGIAPEEVVAENDDGNMRQLLDAARVPLGELAPGWVYYLNIPAFPGGAYAMPNRSMAPIDEIIGVAGDIARQARDLPKGTPVQLKVVD